MQDRWVGDIGDYGKYALLRALCGTPEFPNPEIQLGVVWYYTENTGSPAATTRDYLTGHGTLTRMSSLDQHLYDNLQFFINEENWRVELVKERNILPVERENYFSCPVGTYGNRVGWCKKAIKGMHNVNLLFLDPNTGTHIRRQSRQAYQESDWARSEDLTAFADTRDKDRSLIVFQQTSKAKFPNDDLRRILALKNRLGRRVWTFHWGTRHFLIIPAERHREILWENLETFRRRWETEMEP